MSRKVYRVEILAFYQLFNFSIIIKLTFFGIKILSLFYEKAWLTQSVMKVSVSAPFSV